MDGASIALFVLSIIGLALFIVVMVLSIIVSTKRAVRRKDDNTNTTNQTQAIV